MRLSSDKGVVAVVFAIVLAGLIGISALAVDVGYWYASQQQLQTAADSAAMAGCQQLALDASNAEVWSVVEDYAHRNFRLPLGEAACSVVPPSPGGMSDIADGYVKVTVESDSPTFLSRVIHGADTTRIRAQAVASVGYLAGADGPTPWGLNILRVGEMSAVLGGSSTEMWDQGDGLWSGAFGLGASGVLDLTATNSSGYVKTFSAISRVGALPADGMIGAVDVSASTFTSGIDTQCRVEVSLTTTLGPADTVKAILGRSSVNLVLDATTGTYVGVLGVPTTSDAYIVVPLSVRVQKERLTQQADAAVLVRRANFIIRDLDVSPLFAGPSDTVSIDVRTLDFEQGVTYELKVEGGAGSEGNFQALDFGSIEHSLCGLDGPDPTYTGGSSYSDWIVGVSGLVVHLNDLVVTLPGDKVGPTSSGINQRLSGQALLTLAQWDALGRPKTRQLFTVPICEQIEDANGRTVFKIVSFGAFFMESPPRGSQDPVTGVFVEYTSPGMVVIDDPPYGIVVEAVHLDSEHLDF